MYIWCFQLYSASKHFILQKTQNSWRPKSYVQKRANTKVLLKHVEWALVGDKTSAFLSNPFNRVVNTSNLPTTPAIAEHRRKQLHTPPKHPTRTAATYRSGPPEPPFAEDTKPKRRHNPPKPNPRGTSTNSSPTPSKKRGQAIAPMENGGGLRELAGGGEWVGGDGAGGCWRRRLEPAEKERKRGAAGWGAQRVRLCAVAF